MSMNSLLLFVQLITASAGVFGLSDQGAALRLAHQIARYDGYIQSNGRHIEYEITDPVGNPTYPGYVTVQIRSNLQTIFDVSVNTSKNTAYDFTRCLAFDYPFMKSRKSTKSGNHVMIKSLMLKNGCDAYRVLRRRGQEY